MLSRVGTSLAKVACCRGAGCALAAAVFTAWVSLVGGVPPLPPAGGGASLAPVASAMPLPSQQTIIVDSARGWSLTLPSNWEAAPLELVADAQRVIDSGMPEAKVTYLHGFVLTGLVDASGIPAYVLLQHQPQSLTKLTYEQLEILYGSVQARKNIDEALTRIPGAPSASNLTASVDRARNRILMRSALQLPREGGVSASIEHMSIGFLMKDGVLQLNCYAPTQSFAAAEPEFLALAAQIVIDKDRMFSPFVAAVARPATSGWTWVLVLVGAAGIAVAAAVAGVAVVKRGKV